MKRLFTLFCCVTPIFIIGCVTSPSAKMTNKYIEIKNPGQALGLVEVKAQRFDSIFGYPTEERELVAYTVVNRKTHKSVSPHANFKLFFNTKNKKYCWKISPDPFSSVSYYSDTIRIKPYTWYRLTTENYDFSVYFFLKESEGVYLSKLKPKPGAY